MHNRRPRRHAMFGLSALLWAPAVAPAATYTWIGSGGGYWSNSRNWSGGIVPVSDPSTSLVFSGTTSFASHNNLPSPFLLSQLRLSTSAPFASIDGAPLTFVRTSSGIAPQITWGVFPNTVIIGNDINTDTQL